MLDFSLGIMAYNEEQNIAKLLTAVQNQQFKNTELREVWIVASGCTDRTIEIAQEYAAKNPKIKILVQEKREGKSSAINLWLKHATADLLVLESADTIPEEGTLEKLILPFQDSKIGMTGARPIPMNSPKKLMGYAAHLLWKLHHLIALQNPKMGEAVAFRNTIREIPASSAVDEAEIEAEIRKQGYEVLYIPDAIVRNKGPENIPDFLKQRRRIHAGHLALKEKENYSVSTMSGRKIFSVLMKSLDWNLKSIFFTPLVVLLEIWGRFLGWYDWRIKKRKHHIWATAESTKKLN